MNQILFQMECLKLLKFVHIYCGNTRVVYITIAIWSTCKVDCTYL